MYAVEVSTGITDREHCWIPAPVRRDRGLAVGDQVRLVHEGLPALFTIQEGDRFAIGVEGRARLQGDGHRFQVELGRTVVTDTDREHAAETGDFVGYSRLGGPIAALAPHGGHIEPGTDAQAKRFVTKGGSAWWCAGFWPGGGAFDRWHVTSNDLSPDSFPGLRRLQSFGIDRAVSFHGWARSGIGIGGGASRELRARVRDAVARTVEVPVKLATAGEYCGDNPANVVNRVGEHGGIQLEQGIAVRETHWAEIADAVASVLL